MLEEDSISRCQLGLFGMDDTVEAEDLSSANGTFLSGEPIRRATLTDQDVIQAGGCEIRVHLLPHDRTILSGTAADSVVDNSVGESGSRAQPASHASSSNPLAPPRT